MKLVESIPTRGRPDRLANTIKHISSNLALPNTKVIIQVDDDDKPTVDFLQNNPPEDKRITFNIAPREDTVGAKINRAMSEPADVYTIGSDDDAPITYGFDALILEAADRFEDGIGMVYGTMANLSFACMIAPTVKLVEKMGYIQPPEPFPYWFIDHWTDDVAKLIGRISYTDIRSKDTVGKTQEMREPGWWATWFDAAYLVRRRLAHEIIRGDDFIATKKQKEMLLRQYPVVELRSRWINENVRQQSRQLEGWSGLTLNEPRYQRMKKRALEMLETILADPEMPDHERAAFSKALLPPPSHIQSLPQRYVS